MVLTCLGPKKNACKDKQEWFDNCATELEEASVNGITTCEALTGKTTPKSTLIHSECTSQFKRIT